MKTGFSKICINPSYGAPIRGYYENRFTKGIIDDLFVRAVAFDDGEKKAVVIALDIIALPQEYFSIFKVELNKATGIDEEGVFSNILDLSQSLDKYELVAEKIYFDDDYEVTLYFGDIRVKIGDAQNMDEKFSKIKAILPELEGKSGVLQMANYSEEMKTVSFQSDKPLSDPVLVLPDVDTPMPLP